MSAETLFKNRWLGLKVGFVGFVFASIGFGLGWFRLPVVGMVFFWLGWFVAVVGAVLHFRQMFREGKADPNELYPPAKQPWER